ncbi:hypothetical protein N5T96_06825 [Aliarcobacter butzleri]|uniref:hypothetical protein n=1 Tax=Aliarcobacter butzleri TaxID=28197 RepID=UPI0021B2ED56|nr:hypothetical protein [Aliarcobacter butzleri]MCT7566051.1 hypothetical protein [Aliarcobacter butzleri]MCT7573401.1 hypothetical protein [Aliarcobacter butzleri]
MSKNESTYRVDLHILDHAETIYNSIEEYNPLKHKAHFKCSIDTSQLIANGFNDKDKINNVMKLMLDEIINTPYSFRVKTREYTDKNGNKKEYFSTKSFNLSTDTLSAYHNRAFNSDIDFDNIEPHFHFLFNSSKHTGLNYYHLKKHLDNIASKYNLVFHFAEEKENSTNKFQGLMEKCSRFSWFTQKMTDKQIVNYVNYKSDDLTKNLELLYDYATATGNLQFYIKAMNNIKKRLDRLNLDFEFRNNNIREIYPIPIDEITNETLIAIANKDKEKLKELMTRDNFLARDYIKYTNGFQSTIIDELKLRNYIFPLISSNDLVMDNMKGKNKSDRLKNNDRFLSFNNAVKNDILEALKYSKNEIDLKEILSNFGYKDLGFRSQNIQGKRKKTGLKFSYEDKSYTVYFNQIGLDESTILFHLKNNSKANIENSLDYSKNSNLQNIKFFNSFQNKIFKDIYDFESDIDLSRYIIKKDNESIKFTSKDKNIEIEDRIEEILSTENITDEDAKLIAQLMLKKGWTDIKKVDFHNSSKEFTKKIKDEFEKNNSQ